MVCDKLSQILVDFKNGLLTLEQARQGVLKYIYYEILSKILKVGEK